MTEERTLEVIQSEVGHAHDHLSRVERRERLSRRVLTLLVVGVLAFIAVASEAANLHSERASNDLRSLAEQNRQTNLQTRDLVAGLQRQLAGANAVSRALLIQVQAEADQLRAHGLQPVVAPGSVGQTPATTPAARPSTTARPPASTPPGAPASTPPTTARPPAPPTTPPTSAPGLLPGLPCIPLIQKC